MVEVKNCHGCGHVEIDQPTYIYCAICGGVLIKHILIKPDISIPVVVIEEPSERNEDIFIDISKVRL